MFNFKKKPPATAAAGLSACLSGHHIAGLASLKHYFNEIRHLVSASIEAYDELYLATLYRVAEFCQAMPFSATHFHAPYGLFERQLILTVAALKIRRGKLLPNNASTETIVAEEVAWTYALFSASLLSDMGSMQHDREVTLHHANGDPAGIWIPLEGPLYEKARYYQMKFVENKNATDTALLMAALSGRIVPPAAVRWLADKKELYASWWETILHENHHGNVLQEIIEEAAKKSETFLPKKEEKPSGAMDRHLQLNKLTDWLIIKTKECSEQAFQMQQGFFVSETLLNDFITEIIKMDKTYFLQQLAKADFLILKENGFFHSLAPKKFEDRRLLIGIMLNRDFLPKSLQQLPVNNDFKDNILL